MFRNFPARRSARQKWEAELVWFRLRYQDAAKATRCLNLLSRVEACGRLALYYLPGSPVSQLYLGVPEVRIRLVQQMASDFGLSVKPSLLDLCLPEARKLLPMADLPWERPFMGHIVEGLVFVSLLNVQEDKRGQFFPVPPKKMKESSQRHWELPQLPPAGLTSVPVWEPCSLEKFTLSPNQDETRLVWPVGWNTVGRPLTLSGHVNLYGSKQAVVEWLSNQIGYALGKNGSRMVVLDGFGDLVPQLKRKTAVTRLLGEGVRYMDLDSSASVTGLNPLAPVPGESETELISRWQQWFGAMQVTPQGIELLVTARQDGVSDIPTLKKWLRSGIRKEQYLAATSLQLALERLTASRSLREQLEWAINPFERLPDQVLLFSCQNKGWAQEQLLFAMLLGIQTIANTRLILHGFPWLRLSRLECHGPHSIIASNGPLMADSTVILTASSENKIHAVVKKFLEGDAVWQENIELLGAKEGVIVSGNKKCWTSWELKS
ncbi:MAG: hypothetical protein H6657_00005 [Ardenticatenaceae bacterium]|nr:hypothetical protein [Ardenticatenaceae bacterium]